MGRLAQKSLSMATDIQSSTIHDTAASLGISEELLSAILEEGLLSDEENVQEPEKQSLLMRIRRLHEGLGVNVAGIAVIMNMRDRMLRLQEEVAQLRRELGFYQRGSDAEVIVVEL